MEKILFVLNDACYGSERSYNGIRLARNIAIKNGAELKLFLMGDAAGCAQKKQKVPAGYYNIEQMLASLTKRSVAVGVCGTCIDARGIGEDLLAEGVKRSTLDELTEWTVWADKVIVF